jgi:hypothetical protein
MTLVTVNSQISSFVVTVSFIPAIRPIPHPNSALQDVVVVQYGVLEGPDGQGAAIDGTSAAFDSGKFRLYEIRP